MGVGRSRPQSLACGCLLCGQAEAWATSQQLLATLGLRVRLQLPFSRTSLKTEAPRCQFLDAHHQGPARESPSCPGKACPFLGSPGAVSPSGPAARGASCWF